MTKIFCSVLMLLAAGHLRAETVVGERPDSYLTPNASRLDALNSLYDSKKIGLSDYSSQLTQLAKPVSVSANMLRLGDKSIQKPIPGFTTPTSPISAMTSATENLCPEGYKEDGVLFVSDGTPLYSCSKEEYNGAAKAMVSTSFNLYVGSGKPYLWNNGTVRYGMISQNVKYDLSLNKETESFCNYFLANELGLQIMKSRVIIKNLPITFEGRAPNKESGYQLQFKSNVSGFCPAL